MSRHKNSGKIVTWVDKNGNKNLGIARNAKQDQAFINVQKVLVDYVDENYNPILDPIDKNKKLVGLVSIEKLQCIGFVD